MAPCFISKVTKNQLRDIWERYQIMKLGDKYKVKVQTRMHKTIFRELPNLSSQIHIIGPLLGHDHEIDPCYPHFTMPYTQEHHCKADTGKTRIHSQKSCLRVYKQATTRTQKENACCSKQRPAHKIQNRIKRHMVQCLVRNSLLL